MFVSSFVLCFVFCICGNDLFCIHVVLSHIVIYKAFDDKLENMYNAYVQCLQYFVDVCLMHLMFDAFEAIYNIYMSL